MASSPLLLALLVLCLSCGVLQLLPAFSAPPPFALFHHRPTDYTDWRVLQQQFGLHSFAAVPLMVAGTVHGVIMAGASAPHTFTQR